MGDAFRRTARPTTGRNQCLPAIPATHQFFMRARCLYVIVLDARAERNSNEEAEYWLEHVRAFGGGAPAMLIGNKADQSRVSLDLCSLKEKYPNVIDVYPLSCTQ